MLENAAINGVVPPEMPLIGKVGDLQAWNDPPRCSWTSFSVAAPGGPNADLRARFDKILPTFVKLQTGKAKRGRRPPKDMSVEQWLIRGERDALVRQNADLLIRVQELEVALRVQRKIAESSNVRIADLTAKLRTLAPLRPLSGKL